MSAYLHCKHGNTTIFSCKSEVKHLECLLTAIVHHVLCPRGVAGPQAACSSLVPTMPVGNAIISGFSAPRGEGRHPLEARPRQRAVPTPQVPLV